MVATTPHPTTRTRYDYEFLTPLWRGNQLKAGPRAKGRANNEPIPAMHANCRILRVRNLKKWWARLGLNQRPLRCERSALPLSYAPLFWPSRRDIAVRRGSGKAGQDIQKIIELIDDDIGIQRRDGTAGIAEGNGDCRNAQRLGGLYIVGVVTDHHGMGRIGA